MFLRAVLSKTVQNIVWTSNIQVIVKSTEKVTFTLIMSHTEQILFDK